MSRPIRLVVLKEVMVAAVASGDGSPIYGYVREGEGLVQALSATAASGPFREIGAVRCRKTKGNRIVPLGAMFFLEIAEGVPMPKSVEVINASEAMDARRKDLLSDRGLKDKTVALLGAGSLGSKVGLLLAEAGVGRFLVVDRDHLDVANLSRHACDVADVGRSKAMAVAELVQRRLVASEAIDVDIVALDDPTLDAMLASVDLAVSTTDSPACQFTVNEACLRTGTAGLFAGAYERACGGEVVLVQPGTSRCLFCAVGFRADISEVAPEERRKAYQSADAQQLMAEPGLGADLAYLSAIATAYALAVLDPTGMRAALASPEHGFLLAHGGSVPRGSHAGLFQSPFDLIYARVQRETPCPVCEWVAPEEKEAVS